MTYLPQPIAEDLIYFSQDIGTKLFLLEHSEPELVKDFIHEVPLSTLGLFNTNDKLKRYAIEEIERRLNSNELIKFLNYFTLAQFNIEELSENPNLTMENDWYRISYNQENLWLFRIYVRINLPNIRSILN